MNNLQLVGAELAPKCPTCGNPLDDCVCYDVEYVTVDEYLAELERTNEDLQRALGTLRAERDALRQVIDRLLDGQVETM